MNGPKAVVAQISALADVPPMTWLGLVLIGLAVVMMLLDWGDLFDLAPEPAPRRRWAAVIGLVGVALVLLGGVAAVLAD